MRVHDHAIGIKKNNRWLYIPEMKKAPSLRLFCFHYAGVSAEIFQQWSAYISDKIELCAIQLPGRARRLDEPPITVMKELIEKLYFNINSCFDIPFAFFGHCMGGLIAFEFTEYLHKNNLPLPVYLFISCFRAPHIPVLHPDLHTLTDDELISVLTAINMRPMEFFNNEYLLRTQLPVLRSDFKLVENSEFDADEVEKVPVPIYGFYATEDDYVMKEHMEEWRHFTLKEFTSQSFSGNHFFLHQHHSLESMIDLLHLVLNIN